MGHFIQTFALANALREREFEVIYLGLRSFRRIVEENGFQFQVVGASVDYEDMPDRAKLLGGGLISRVKNARRFAMAAETITADIKLFLSKAKPRIFFIDTSINHILVVENEDTDMQIIEYSASLNPKPVNWVNPPSSSLLLPSGGFVNKIRIYVAWRRWMTNPSELINRIVEFQFGIPRFRRKYIKKLRNFSAKKRSRIKSVHLSTRFLSLPTQSDGIFLGPCVWKKRVEGNFDWSRVDESKPLFYCSLGSMSDRYPSRIPFFKRLLSVFRDLNAWQLVLHVDEAEERTQIDSIAPDNVQVSSWVPQLEMLDRASVVITHGGYGTVRECVSAGVPIVAFPCGGDQFGVSTRLVYHGIGERGDVRKSGEKEIKYLVEKVFRDEGYRNRIEQIKALALDANELDKGLNQILNQTNKKLFVP